MFPIISGEENMAADSAQAKPYVTSFQGKSNITSNDFLKIFRRFDKDGKFFSHRILRRHVFSFLVFASVYWFKFIRRSNRNVLGFCCPLRCVIAYFRRLESEPNSFGEVAGAKTYSKIWCKFRIISIFFTSWLYLD